MKKKSNNSFVRKIIYIAIIGGLLIPISFISRPEVTDENGQVVDPGGRLSQMRRTNKLAQASISEIDPTSEAMKLASMGLRGVAVNVLWMQALEHQKNEDYDKLAQTLQTLTKVQPNFVKVWEYQGHNLAFNVSMEFDDYEYRYEWVKKGLNFLKSGIAYNINDHRMTDNMGFFTGIKFGKSDEKLPFRRIFRKDTQFHDEMSDYISPDSYDAREYGPDSYMMAWHWYDESERMVDKGADQFRSDLMFRMNRPAQKRQQAMVLSEEFRPDEVIRETWEDASEEWLRFGNFELRNNRDVGFTLERNTQYEQRVAQLRQELDQLAPGARLREQELIWVGMGMNKDELAPLLDAAPEELNNEERARKSGFLGMLNEKGRNFDALIAASAPEDKQLEALRVANEITKTLTKMDSIDNDGGVVNYSFWKSRSAAESTDSMIRARQAMYDASEMLRKSIFEDEFVYDYRTGEKSVIREGAGTLYLEAFAKWDEVLKVHPDLVGSPIAYDLVGSIQEYRQVLLFTGEEWPEDFILQWFIDQRVKMGDNDGLPTSEELRAMLEDREDAEEAGDDDDDSASEVEESSEEADEENSTDESVDAEVSSEPDASGDDESDAQSD